MGEARCGIEGTIKISFSHVQDNNDLCVCVHVGEYLQATRIKSSLTRGLSTPTFSGKKRKNGYLNG